MMDFFGKKRKAELNRLIGKKVRVYFKNTEMEGELFFSEVYTGFYFLEFENGGGIHFGWRKVKKVVENMYTKVNCIDCVHLPCKVGDTAYFVSAGGVHDFTVGTVAAEVSEEGTLYYIVDKDWLWEGYIGDNVFLDKLQAENKYDGISEDEKPKTKEERKKQWLKDHGIEEIDHLSGQTDVITVLYSEIMKEEQEKKKK